MEALCLCELQHHTAMSVSHEGSFCSVTMHNHALEDKAAAYVLQRGVRTEEIRTVCTSCVGEHVQWLSHTHVQWLRIAKDWPCAMRGSSHTNECALSRLTKNDNGQHSSADQLYSKLQCRSNGKGSPASFQKVCQIWTKLLQHHEAIVLVAMMLHAVVNKSWSEAWHCLQE